MRFRDVLKLGIFCFVLFMADGLQAQSLTGFYTGQMKLSRQRAEMGVQLDLIEKDGIYNAIFRTRYFENNVITGCDNLMLGTLQNGVINFRHLVNIKETEVPQGSCDYFANLKLSLDKKATNPTWTGTVTGSDLSVFGRFKIERIDEENSFSVKDEMEVVMRKLGEVQILNEPVDSLRNKLMLAYRPTRITDTVSLKAGGELRLRIDAPDADPFHKLTVLVNGRPVMENKAPKQQPLQIRFADLVEGELEILLLCNHAMVEVNYPVVVTLQSASGDQIVYTNVTTIQNTGLLLKINP